jgi:hypothetical protein
MALILRPSMGAVQLYDSERFSSVSDNNSDEYHLRFLNSDTGPQYGRKVDFFLDEIFSNTNGNPLKYDHHIPSRQNGRLSALVRFRLSNYGSQRGITLEIAAVELCRRIFDPIYRNWLILVTTDSFLGVSAACESWSRYISRAFFRESFEEGPAVLDDMIRARDVEYLPQWAVVFAFAVVSGLSLSVFSTGSHSERALQELMGVAGAGRAAQILEKFVTQRPDRREIELNWRRQYRFFEIEMQKLPNTLEDYIGM